MAIHLLENNGALHIPLYDLQSFFFVLVWICILYEGPQLPRTELPSVLTFWLAPLAMDAIATFKCGQVLTDGSFKNSLACNFTKHFQDLRDFANEFRKAIIFHAELASLADPHWRANVDPHDKVIELFNKELGRREQEVQARQKHEQAQACRAHDNTATPQNEPQHSPRGVAAGVARLVNDQLKKAPRGRKQ
jgi:hypothetical protein